MIIMPISEPEGALTMSMERLETAAPRGTCPVCAAVFTPRGPVEDTEILPCPECQTMLVVERREGSWILLGEAPQIEEDWGE
jgi:hypothetical protein